MKTIWNKHITLFISENIVFTKFSGIIKNLVLSVLYYHLPFLSKIETQVLPPFLPCPSMWKIFIPFETNGPENKKNLS